MDRLTSPVVVQAWAVGLFNWFIGALPVVVLMMSATLTALQLYVFVRDKLRKPNGSE